MVAAQGYFPNPANQNPMPMSGSNQFFPTLPSLPAPNPIAQQASPGASDGTMPGQQLSTPGTGPGAPNPFTTPASGLPQYAQLHQAGGGYLQESTQNPALTQSFNNYLMSMLGRGATPFSGTSPLATGGITGPGQLNAPLNPLLQQLLTQLSGGSTTLPGGNTLTTIANEGISALPEWQSMIAAMNQNTQQNEAQLREQFASMGGLAGSPFGTAMSNYLQQTNLSQNALLGQLQQQNILQGQIPVAQGLQGLATQAGQYFQGLNQQDIQNVYNEFLRTQPEYSPLLGLEQSAAFTYPPMLQKTSGGGILGGLLGSAGGLASMGASGISGGLAASAGGAGTLSSILAGLAAI